MPARVLIIEAGAVLARLHQAVLDAVENATLVAATAQVYRQGGIDGLGQQRWVIAIQKKFSYQLMIQLVI